MILLTVSVHSSTVSFRKGVSLSPRSYSSSDFSDFFAKAKQAGSVVTWAGDWLELSHPSSAPFVVTDLASSYGYTPLIELQFFSQSSGQLLRPLDDLNRKTYLDSAVAFAAKYKPNYLALGIEVNILFEKSPADFQQFTSFYGQVYDAVRAVSPGTKVFTIFQLEKMKGMGGGLFGGTNDSAKNEWSLLESFPKNDLLALTTYPSLVYKDPSDIPNDYYSEISLHSTRPVALTETGWHSNPSPSGWEGSDGKQTAFVNRLFAISGLNLELVIWSFLYDQNTIEPFNSMGFWRQDGTSKPSWQTWLSASAATLVTTTPSPSSLTTTSAQGGSPKCIIATAAFGSDLAPPVQFLREFRDTNVKSTYLGQRFMMGFDAWYYSWSPAVAAAESQSEILRALVRALLMPLLASLFTAQVTFTALAPTNEGLAILSAGLAASVGLGVFYLSPIICIARHLLGKRFGRRAFAAAALSGLVLALFGTLSNGVTDSVAIITVIVVTETMLLSSLGLVEAATGRRSIEFEKWVAQLWAAI